MKRILTTCLLLTATVVHAQLAAIRTLKPEEGQEVRRPIEAKIFGAAPEELPGLEQELLAIFKSMDTTLEGKQYACRMLRFCASDACVPVLAPKLTSVDLSMFVRLVLQGLDSPAAEQALINGLAKAGNPALKAGIIGTLGQHHGSAASIRAIRPYLKNSNAELQLAAITALGNIGGQASVQALVQAKVNPKLTNAWIQAQLKCVGSLDEKNAEAAYRKYFKEKYDEQIRAAALVGMVALSPEIAADSVLTALASDNACLKQTATGLLDRTPTDQLIGALDSVEPDLQVRVLEILADRKASQAEGAVLTLAAGENETVRIAAYEALAMVGGKQAVEMLITKAPQDEAAFDALCAFQVDGTDAVVMNALQAAGDDKVKSRLLECLSQRGATSALPLFIEEAKGAWSRSCMTAIDGMATLVSEDDFSVYADLLKNSDNRKKSEALEKSIATAAQRLSDFEACARPLIQAADDAEGETKYTLIRALGGIDGDETKKLLIEAAKSSDPKLQDAAVRGLANWPSLDAAPELLEIATGTANETHRVLVLRGYLRLANGLSREQEAIPMCRNVMEVTDRPDVLKSVIACAKRFRSKDTVDFLAPMLDNPAIANEAGWAIYEISRRLRMEPAAVESLGMKILECTTDEKLKKAVQAGLDELKSAQ